VIVCTEKYVFGDISTIAGGRKTPRFGVTEMGTRLLSVMDRTGAVKATRVTEIEDV